MPKEPNKKLGHFLRGFWFGQLVQMYDFREDVMEMLDEEFDRLKKTSSKKRVAKRKTKARNDDLPKI